MTFESSERHGSSTLAVFGVTILLASLMLIGPAQAQVVSWSYDSSGTVGGEGAGDHSGLGGEAGVTPAGNWTNSFPSNLTHDLQDNTGTSTLLDLSYDSFNTWQIQSSHPGQDADSSWNKEMLNGYLNAGPASWAPPITYSEVALSQIPYDNYDIYVYFSSDQGEREGDVTDLTTTYSFTTVGPSSIAGASATLSQTTDTGGTYATAANYAVFSGLSGDTQTVRVQMRDEDEWAGIAGFQVVNTGAVAPVLDWKNDASGSFSLGANWVGDSAPSTNDDARFGNVITEDRTVTIDTNVQLNSVTFDNIGDGDYFLAPASNQTLTLTGDANLITFGRHWVRTELAGSAVNTLGDGELILDAANSFSVLNVNETSATVTHAEAIPTGTPITIENSGAVRFFGADNGFFFDHGTGLDPNSTLSFTSAVSIVDSASFIDFNDGANATISGVISGEGGLGVQNANVSVTSAQSYNGVTNTSAGAVLTITASGTLGSATGGTSIFGDGTVVLDSISVGDERFDVTGEGQLQLNGSTTGASPGSALIDLDESADGTRPKIASSSSSTINHNIHAGVDGDGSYYEIASNSGTLTLSGTLSAFDAVEPDDRHYVFSGDGNINVTGRITDAAVDANGDVLAPAASDGVNVHVIKRGAGTMTVGVNADDDYWFGNTTVESGALVLTSHGDNNELFSPVTTIRAGAILNISSFGVYTLGENDELAGGGVINVGSGTLKIFDDNVVTPGDGVGTLSVTGNVEMQDFSTGSGSFNYELGDDNGVAGGSANDLIAMSGSLTGATSAAFNIRATQGSLEAGSYRLMNHSGGSPTFSGVVQAVDAEGAPLTIRQTLSIATTTNQVNLNVSGNAPRNLHWKGTPDANWSVAGTANFGQGSAGGASSDFYDLDTVTFGAGATTTTVNVTENVAPHTMTVGGGQNYTFTGSDINATSLTVAENATASFSNHVGGSVVVADTGAVAGTSTFKNDVTVQSGGTLRIGGASMPGAVGTISWTVDNNGTVGGDGAGSLPALSEEAGVTPVGGWTNEWPDYDYTELRDDSGNPTTLDIAPFSNSGTWNINNFAHAGQDTDGSWSKEMLTGYLNSGAGSGEGGAGVVISEIPYALYDIIAYFNSDNDTRTGSVSDGATTYVFKAAGAAGSFGADGNATFLEATALTTTSDAANYAVFSGLTGASQTITVDIPDYGGLAGFQVIGDPSSQSPAGETMFVLGDVSLEEGATTSFNIAASGVNDHLDIAGNLDVAEGFILEVLLDNSVPASSLVAGDSWDLFDFDSATGAFDDLDFVLPSGLSSGLAWDTSSLLADGILTVATAGLPGDFNNDGSVDAADYTVYRDNLGDDVTLPNDDGLGEPVSTAHYDLWRSNYGATSAVASGLVANVPEPTSVLLLLGAIASGASLPRRRRLAAK